MKMKHAWIFSGAGKAGNCVDGIVLNPIAKDVTTDCKGLLLALATVAVAF